MTVDTVQGNSKIWFLDSGASRHMSPNKSWFTEFESLTEPTQIKVGNGDTIWATGKGVIDVKVFNGSTWSRKHLSGVLYVPDLKYNLFSVTAALDKGHYLKSDKTKCSLEKDGSTVAVGVRKGNLFELQLKVIESKSTSDCCESANISKVESAGMA